MEELLLHLQDLLLVLWGILVTVTGLLAPWLPLAAWVLFWTFAVDWVKLREVMVCGGVIGVLLIGFAMILIWGVVAPPPDNYHYLLGLKLSNFVGKTVYVTGLIVIMFLCGSVQLSGCCARCCQFDETPEAGH